MMHRYGDIGFLMKYSIPSHLHIISGFYRYIVDSFVTPVITILPGYILLDDENIFRDDIRISNKDINFNF